MKRLLAPLLVLLALACALVPASVLAAGDAADAATTASTTTAASPVSAAQIDAYLAGKGSPMAGQGSAFLASGGRWQVDPRLIVAISGAESSFGAITCAPFNAWGYGCPNGPFQFASWAEGIDTVAQGLRTNYIAEGRTSVALINLKYAPIGAANDPTGLNNNWTINVSRFLTELGGDPNDIDLAGVGGTRLLGVPGALPGFAGGTDAFGFEEDTVAAPAPNGDTSPSAETPVDLIVAAGAPDTLIVTVKNTGTATWTPADVRLDRTDTEPRVVGAPYGALRDDAVAPGATAHFAVALAAAGAQDGSVTTTWRLEGPGGPFGSAIERRVGFEIPAYVVGAARSDVTAAQGDPASAGSTTYTVLVHVRNAGAHTWERDGDHAVVLGQLSATGSLQHVGWLSDQVAARMLERSVAPGQEASFAFRVLGGSGALDMTLATNDGFAPTSPIVVRIGS